MAQLSSDKIKVYPSGYRDASIDVEASRTTEGSVTRANMAPLSSGSYAKLESDNSITLVLGGYIFNIEGGISTITDVVSPQLTDNSIYAYAHTKKITSTTDSISMTMLVSSSDDSTLDANNKFTSLEFVTTQPNTSSYPLQLKVLEKDASGNWVIPDASKLNISASQVGNIANSVPDNNPISKKFDTNELNVANTATIEDLTVTSINLENDTDDNTNTVQFHIGGSEFKHVVDNVTNATKAQQDAKGNNIVSTYLMSDNVNAGTNMKVIRAFDRITGSTSITLDNTYELPKAQSQVLGGVVGSLIFGTIGVLVSGSIVTALDLNEAGLNLSFGNAICFIRSGSFLYTSGELHIPFATKMQSYTSSNPLSTPIAASQVYVVVCHGKTSKVASAYTSVDLKVASADASGFNLVSNRTSSGNEEYVNYIAFGYGESAS